MTITTRRVYGVISLPNGGVPSNGRATVALSGPDAEGGTQVILGPLTIQLDEDGAFDATLWCTDTGSAGRVYVGALKWHDGTRPQSLAMTFDVPSGSGDLAFLPVWTSAVPESTQANALAQCLAAAEQAATDSAAAAASAARIDLGALDDAVAATAADRVQTGLDVAATAADRVATAADVVAASTAQTAAEAAQALAETARDITNTYAGLVDQATSVADLTDPATLSEGDHAVVSGSGDDTVDGLYEVQSGVWVRVGDTGLAGKADAADVTMSVQQIADFTGDQTGGYNTPVVVGSAEITTAAFALGAGRAAANEQPSPGGYLSAVSADMGGATDVRLLTVDASGVVLSDQSVSASDAGITTWTAGADFSAVYVPAGGNVLLVGASYGVNLQSIGAALVTASGVAVGSVGTLVEPYASDYTAAIATTYLIRSDTVDSKVDAPIATIEHITDYLALRGETIISRDTASSLASGGSAVTLDVAYGVPVAGAGVLTQVAARFSGSAVVDLVVSSPDDDGQQIVTDVARIYARLGSNTWTSRDFGRITVASGGAVYLRAVSGGAMLSDTSVSTGAMWSTGGKTQAAVGEVQEYNAYSWATSLACTTQSFVGSADDRYADTALADYLGWPDLTYDDTVEIGTTEGTRVAYATANQAYGLSTTLVSGKLASVTADVVAARQIDLIVTAPNAAGEQVVTYVHRVSGGDGGLVTWTSGVDFSETHTTSGGLIFIRGVGATGCGYVSSGSLALSTYGKTQAVVGEVQEYVASVVTLIASATCAVLSDHLVLPEAPAPSLDDIASQTWTATGATVADGVITSDTGNGWSKSTYPTAKPKLISNYSKLQAWATISAAGQVWGVGMDRDSAPGDMPSTLAIIDDSDQTFRLGSWGGSAEPTSEATVAIPWTLSGSTVRVEIEREKIYHKATLTNTVTGQSVSIVSDYEDADAEHRIYMLMFGLPAVCFATTTAGGVEVTRLRARSSRPWPNDLARVVLIGDSITEGSAIPADMSSTWSHQLVSARQSLGAQDAVVCARGSGTTASVLTQLSEILRLIGSDTRVVIKLGTNDKGGTLTNWRTNLGSIISQIKEKTKKLHLCTVVPSTTPGILADMNADILDDYFGLGTSVVRMDLAVSDDNDGVTVDADLYVGDGLHPNAAGNALMYQRLLLDLPEVME